MTNKQHVKLTPIQLATIKKWRYDDKRFAANNFEDFMVIVWKEVCGYDVRDEGIKLDPTAFAIPKSQWQELVSFMLEHAPFDVRASWSMNWVNYSPSAYDDDEVVSG